MGSRDPCRSCNMLSPCKDCCTTGGLALTQHDGTRGLNPYRPSSLPAFQPSRSTCLDVYRLSSGRNPTWGVLGWRKWSRWWECQDDLSQTPGSWCVLKHCYPTLSNQKGSLSQAPRKCRLKMTQAKTLVIAGADGFVAPLRVLRPCFGGATQQPRTYTFSSWGLILWGHWGRF